MEAKQLIVALSLAAAVAIVGMIAFIIFEKKKQKKKVAQIVKSGKSSNQSLNVFLIKSYAKLGKWRFFNNLLIRIRKKVETVSVYDDMDVRREVMKIFYIMLFLGFGVLFLLLLFRPGWLVAFWVFVGILFGLGLITDQFINRTEMKLLNQLKYYNSRVRHYFQQLKMVDDAAYEAIQDVGPEMKVQATRIHQILTNIYPDEKLTKYEEVAPSRFLKVVAGLMVLVKDKGDIIDEKRGSAFARGLSAITKELNLEIMYRTKLAYRMRFLAGMALAPIFFALPIQKHITNMFPILQKFYESRTGLIAAVLIYSSAVGVYLLIRKIKSVGEVQYKAGVKEFIWEKWLLVHIPFLNRFMVLIGPSYGSKKHAKRLQLLKDANSHPHIEWLTLRQSTLAIVTVAILVTVLIIGHNREEHSTLYSVLPESLMSGNVSEDEYQEYVKQTEFDSNFIKDLQSRPSVTQEEVLVDLAAYFGADELDDSRVISAYTRIMGKYKIVENAYFKWWELVVVIFVASVVWYIPIVLLIFQRTMRLKDMENEVHQFLTIISILREFDNITVFTLLNWLERFAVTFKEPLQVTIQNYDSGAEQALEDLSDTANFDAFKQIVDRMQLALVRLSVQEAFEDIEIEREFYLEQRIEFNERSINSRVSISSLMSFLPSALLLILYFVGPVLYMSISEMLSLMNSL